MKVDEFVAVMESFEGIIENPLGSNRTPIGVEFGWNGVAWCAMTVSVACKRLGYPLHEAAVIRIAQRAQAGDYGLKWTKTPTRGAIACFDFGFQRNPQDMHTGVVKAVRPDNLFNNIEGNHRDRCEEVPRDMKYVWGFAVPPFEVAPVVSSYSVSQVMVGGQPALRHVISVPMDENGNGYTNTDIPYDKTLSVTGHAPLYPPRDKRYGRQAKAAQHVEDGKLVVFVEGGEPKQTAVVIVLSSD